jgi:hypothetical protein
MEIIQSEEIDFHAHSTISRVRGFGLDGVRDGFTREYASSHNRNVLC